jgi:hypothetical protein
MWVIDGAVSQDGRVWQNLVHDVELPRPRR